LRLLDACREKKIDKLFLAGDIFDLWIADRPYFTARYAEVVQSLGRLIQTGCEVHYFEGNHDLDLTVFWRDQVGAVVHGEAAYFSLEGLTVRVEHGDQMDPDDRGYLFLRWLLRTPVVRFLGRHLPDRLVQWIGTRASHASREYTSQIKTVDPQTARTKIRRHAALAFAQQPFQLMVSGHVHIVDDAQFDTYRSVNLGTWLEQPRVFELSAGRADFYPAEEWIQLK
jgi:UDP-2,3-diacylglucosamine hydrolase